MSTASPPQTNCRPLAAALFAVGVCLAVVAGVPLVRSGPREKAVAGDVVATAAAQASSAAVPVVAGDKFKIRYWNEPRPTGRPEDAYFSISAASSAPTVFSRGRPTINGRSLLYVDWGTGQQISKVADHIIVEEDR